MLVKAIPNDEVESALRAAACRTRPRADLMSLGLDGGGALGTVADSGKVGRTTSGFRM